MSLPSIVRIEPLRAEQCETLVSLARRIWFDHYPGIISEAQIEYMLGQRYQPAELRAQTHQPGHLWLVAVDGQDRLVGYAHATHAPGERETWKLEKLYVDTGQQRQGIGSRLLAEVERQAIAAGAKRLLLQVNKNNVRAIAAYRKQGFQQTNSIVVDIGGGFVMDDHLMAKSLY